MRFSLAFTALLALSCAAFAVAQDEAPAEPQPQAVEGVIRAVRGPLVQIRLTPDDAWQKAEPGMRVPVGAELRTGPRSMIQFELPPDQIVTIDRATVITLLQAAQADGRAITDIGMTRGRTTYQVTDPEIHHEAKVRSPNATNAVRGTQQFGIADDALYGPMVFAVNTPTTVTNAQGKQIPFGGKGASSEMSGEASSEGEHYFVTSILDPSGARSRTEVETQLIGRFPGIGGVDGGGIGGDINRDVTPTPIIIEPQEPIIFPDSRLIAALFWFTTADLDIFVIDSDGYRISTFTGVGEGFVNTAPNGGTAGPDITFGPGVEYIAYLNQTIPTGEFEVGASHWSGPDTEFTIQVYKDGQQVGQDFVATVGANNRIQSTVYDIPHDDLGDLTRATLADIGR